MKEGIEPRLHNARLYVQPDGAFLLISPAPLNPPPTGFEEVRNPGGSRTRRQYVYGTRDVASAEATELTIKCHPAFSDKEYEAQRIIHALLTEVPLGHSTRLGEGWYVLDDVSGEPHAGPFGRRSDAYAMLRGMASHKGLSVYHITASGLRDYPS